MAIFTSNFKRPRYFDRQQLRADDLNLEQQYLNQRNRQLNRHLHGWGIACGVLIESIERSLISLSEGYAVTPLGDALHIPDIDELDLLPLLKAAACGDDAVDCEADIAAIEEAAVGRAAVEKDRIEFGAKQLYLVALPVERATEARTGVPEDCGHPGNNLEFSRVCDAVCLQIVCDLPAIHKTKKIECDDLRGLFCPEKREQFELEALLKNYLSCPPAISDAENYVVIARLNVSYDGGSIDSIDYENRRLLISTQMMQEYLSCFCDAPTPTPTPTFTTTPTPTFTIKPTPTFTIEPTPTFTIKPTPTFTIEPTATFTIRPTSTRTFLPTGRPTSTRTFLPTGRPTDIFIVTPTDGVVIAGGIIDESVIAGIDVMTYDTVRGAKTSIDELILLSDAGQGKLKEMGVNSILDLYAADTEEVAEKLGVSEVQVAEHKDNALESMKRAEVINLDTNEFDVSKGLSLPVEEVNDIGRVRGEKLSRAGYASVADIANTNSTNLAKILSISESHAGALIEDAVSKVRKL